MQRCELVDVAAGRVPADLLIRGGRLVNVHTAEIYRADVTVKGDRIAAVGEVGAGAVGPKTVLVEADGHYLTPGLIETHQHVAGSHLSMTEFARVVLAHGTTAMATDFYEIAAVGGVKAVRWCLDELRATPLKVMFVIPMPAFYQNEKFGHTGSLDFKDMVEMLHWPECYGLNEAFASRVLAGDAEMLELVRLTRELGKTVVGHASEFTGERLQAWLAAVGSTNDHECISAEEALEKARLGIRILLREGSAASDVVRVSRAITGLGADPRMFAFCTDEEEPLRLGRVGHLDEKIRLAVSAGVNPVTAVQMATLNGAETYGVSREMGSVTPGKLADILLVKDLRTFEVSTVIASGKVVASEGHYTGDLRRPTHPDFARGTVRLKAPARPSDFRVAAPDGVDRARVRVIVCVDGDLVTTEREAVLPCRDGEVLADVRQDVAKIAVLERHHASGKIGVGFIHGFGLKRGALGSTFNPHTEDLAVVGTNDRDLAVAANRVAELGGGFVAVADGKVVGELPLPLFGLLSDLPVEEVYPRLDRLYASVRELGCQLRGPFTSLGFMCLPTIIGNLKICCEGVVDVWKEQLVDIVSGVNGS
ncbi:MAG: adenine deaminase [Bacillota bacterium]|nr:MAG: adenine deaminase [Bacillota bacterium]